MDPLLSPSARETLLSRLSELLQRAGWERFVTAPLLLPEPTYFPDRWTPDGRGVRRLALRLLRYAGIGHLDAAIALANPEELEGRGGGHIAAWFAGIEGEVCRFGVRADLLEHGDLLLGAMCHEIAHAFRTFHGLMEKAPEHRAREEENTDMTTVYLGGGLLMLRISERLRLQFDLAGPNARYVLERASAGYLSLQAMAFLLAVQTSVRELPEEALKPIEEALGNHQAAYFRAALKQFEGEPGKLRERLGIPDRAAWPAPAPVDDSPIRDDDHASTSSLTHTVFRVVDHTGPAGAVVGGIVMATLTVPLRSGMGTAIVVASAGVILGWLVGRSVRQDECSGPNCRARLPYPAAYCPSCAGQIGGEIARPEDRMEMQALFARLGPQAARVRYREQRAQARRQKLTSPLVLAMAGLGAFMLLMLLVQC